MRKKNRKYVFLAILLLLLATGSVALLKSPIGRVLLKSKAHFKTSAIDSRVRYEPGAEDYAEKIARALQEAIDRVEKGHFITFKKPVKVYVYRSQESFSSYIVMPGKYARGAASAWWVYIAPLAFNFRGIDTHKQSLAHELSHHHLKGRLGFGGLGERLKVPTWFSEGLANEVAGSGGEGISDQEARDAIKQGTELLLKEKGSLFGAFHKDFSNMHGWMFHKQNRLFLEYIRANHSVGLEKTMTFLYLGAAFNDSFRAGFGMDIDEMWDLFKADLLQNK